MRPARVCPDGDVDRTSHGSNRFDLDVLTGRQRSRQGTPPREPSPIARRFAVALLAAGLTLSACTSSAGDSGDAGGGTFAVWDPYPRFDGGSQWATVVEDCGARAGVAVERQAYDTSDLTNKVLLAAQQGVAPNALVVDNPVVSTLAEAGMPKANQDTGVDASPASPNLLAAGESEGMTYGVPIGANTLALYYNKAVFADSTIAVPFAVLILASFMSTVPDEVVQAARIDGAGALRVFWSVVLPASRNGVVTAGLFAFLWAWSDFLFAATLDSGGALKPLTLGIYRYTGNNNQEWNAIMATAVVASVPATALLVLAQRFVAADPTPTRSPGSTSSTTRSPRRTSSPPTRPVTAAA
ncbi:extracellular solute-binding protein [Saccharothrix texasensis]|uniref:Extracellular solute-binding protein n=1 Tax=Saccharothrix texasensis TaxID=103734 RepID=A0A3N1H0T3_9PSEU|nr:extracellular solute-binding protein [Saccharothrix texasensis]ROP35872.1 extracellular solute-binding protein [Saccharothrix texasensis]